MVLSPVNREEVLACGMSCRLPGCDNVNEFWDQLVSKVNLVTTNKSRWDPAYLGLPEKSGNLKDISKFDASFFGILPKQVNKMDPQLRLLLEVSYEAIVDAGFSPHELKGSNTGVYVASSYAEADFVNCGDMKAKDGYGVTGSFRTFQANRLSYYFDFKGPSYSLDAACSSGLVALHNAMQDILNGQCDYAVVGGVTVILRPQTTHGLNSLGVLARDGKCKTFDKSANGFVRSEAIVAVFLSKKTLCRRVYAHLVNSVTNHCGFVQQGITYPSYEAQKDLLSRAYSAPGVSRDEVEFIETHGTGTDVGDPIETNAIHSILCDESRNQNPLLIGAVKSNIGHNECTAGLTSLLKVLMTINNEIIPPNLHFNTPNPKIKGLQDGTLKVVTEPTKFKGGLIGISSFGFGGTNAHAVVKPYRLSKQYIPCNIPSVLLSSGRTKQSVQENLTYMSAYTQDPEFHRLANQVANTPGDGMPFRGYKVLSNQNDPTEIRKMDGGVSKQIWYILPGMGSDWPGMGKDLMILPVFQQTINRCHEYIANTDPEINLLDLMMNSSKEKLDRTMAKFVTNTSIQVALVNCLKDLGIHPDGMIGFSMGEIACAYADNLLSEEQAVMAAYWRGRCVLDTSPPPGCMASVELGWDDVKARIPTGIVTACRNAENNTTVSGDAETVDRFLSEIVTEGIFVRKVSTDGVAYHSPHMIPVAPLLRNKLNKIIPHQALRSKSWLSTSYPEELWETPEAKMLNTSYLVNNLVSPVLFYDAVRKIPPSAIVIEVAPHGSMKVLLQRTLHSGCDYLSLMSMKEPDNLHYFLSAVGKLFSFGISVDTSKLYPPIEYPVGTGISPLSPGIKWDHSTEWAVPSWEDFVLDGSGDRSTTSYEVDITENASNIFLKDHNVDGRILYPATGYIVLAWRAVASMLSVLPENLAIDLSDINIHRATIIREQKGNVTFKVRVSPAMNFFEISENNELTMSGKYNIPEVPFVPVDISQEVDESRMLLRQDDIYKEFRLIGYRYGPSFQGIKRSHLDGHQAYVEWNGNWITFLDSMLQVSILGKNNPSRSILLPTRILSIRINPLLHPSIDTKHREIPIKNDRVVSSCRSGGVEIVRLHTTMVQKRQVKQNPTLEYVQFVPYGENKIKVSSHVAHYGTICKQYLGRVLKNIASVYTNITLKSLQVTKEIKDIANDVSRYLNDNECGYIKVLHQFDQLKGSGDLVLDVLNVLDNNAVQLFQDKLLLGLLCDGSFKNLLDVILENSTTSKITVVEIGVRYGGMFSHIVPIFMSEPLYKLEFTATDRHVSSMSSTLKDQLRTFRVKLSQFDINKDNDIAFSSKGLVVVRGLAQQAECIRSALQKIHSILADGGFLLLYEVTSNFELYYGVDEIIYHFPRKDLKERKHCIYLMSSQWEEKLQSSGFEVIQQLSDSVSSTVFLCRKVEKVSKCVFIPITGKEFDWVEDLKLALKEEQTKDGTIRKIWLIADGDYQSGIVGMVNCLRKEDGGSNVRCIFNASDNVHLQEVQLEPSLMAELARKDLVMNVFKDGLWGSFRHCSLRKDNIYKETLNPRVYLNTLTRGDLSSLCWIESPTTNEATSSDHIPCTVYYSSLNFRDVMIASGKLTADSVPEFLAHQECLLGYEFSGRDPAGKRVMGLVSSKGLATYVNAEPHTLFDVPDTWSLEDAATVPLIYSTVYYALIVRGQLRRGETVLIHSGSGGVGQAAITVALSYSCKIYTTVGTSEKRRFLMKKFPELTESSFANSHDLSFEEHVMRQTDGLGVNLILNSLSEEKFDASLRCLSTHGRFLEIGKYDLSQNRKIGGSIFLKDTSFHGVVLTQLLERGNVEWPRVFDVMKKGLRSGVVQPISRTVFSPDEAEKAFRFMSQGKHIGKILIKVKAEETATTPLWKSISVKSTSSPQPKKVYVIIGGLGGFGLELADWLVARGCKKLVLTSRSGITTGYQSRCISRWQGRGVTVIVSGNDVSDSSACYQLLFDCQKMGPIGGIFNLALVLKDGLFENLASDDFKAVCQPKTEIASNLDQATRQICGPELDWFVMFSSVTSGRGNAGQSNYGFGNSSMERICEERNKDNLPGIAIQWGVIGDVGRVVDTMNVSETEIAGCVSQTIESCLSTLDLFLVQPYPVLSTIVPADREKSISEDTSRIDMQNFVTKFFGIKDLSSLNQNITLAELGLDSLMGVEVKQTLERDFATIMSMKQIRSLTLGGLLNHIGRESSSNIGKTDDRCNSTSEITIPLRVSPILSSKETNCLVQLNTGQMQNSPVFLFHPIEGTIDVFRPLIPSLKDHPVYALTVNKEVPQDSIFKMATYYLSKMRSVQPDGPYNIAGYSFGAVLALELVIYLQNEYNLAPQHNLMLIDASPDYVKSRFRKVLEEQMEDEHIQAVGLRDATNVQILVQFIQGFQQMELNELKQKLLAKASYVEQLDLAAEILLKDFPDVDKEDMSFSVDSYVKRTWLLKDCKPKSTYRGNITLLKASSSSNVPNQERTNDYGLSKICTGEVKIFTIDGDHESIMQDPGVYDVAQRMKDLFSHGIPNTFSRDT